MPVWMGELSCAALGASVAAYDPAGAEVVDEVGELVVTKPMPSMPVSFWNDPGGSRLRAAYFDHYPGVLAAWRLGCAGPPAARTSSTDAVTRHSTAVEFVEWGRRTSRGSRRPRAGDRLTRCRHD